MAQPIKANPDGTYSTPDGRIFKNVEELKAFLIQKGVSPMGSPTKIGMNTGGRGSYTGPATPNTPINMGAGFSKPAQPAPTQAPAPAVKQGLNVGNRGSYTGPATEATPVDAPNRFTNSNMPQPQQTEEPSFMDRLLSKQGIGAIGAGLLSMSQDPNLQKMGMGQLDRMQTRSSANKTIQMLRAKGENKLADFIEANPAMAKTALTQYLQKEYAAKASLKTSAPIVDPATGQIYVVATDPATGKTYRQNIEGAVGETPTAKAERESNARLTEGDTEAGYNLGAEYFSQAENIRSQIGNFDDALRAIDQGIENGQTTSGFFRDYLPSINAATSALRQAANRMGITVINSATFGALSEQELKMAMSTELDLSLPPAELRKQVIERRAAKIKFAQALEQKAREAQNLGRKAFIDKYTRLQQENPDSVSSMGGSSTIFDEADSIIGG